MSLLNTGGIRGGLPSGQITIADAMAILPFNDTLDIAEMSGHDLKSVS